MKLHLQPVTTEDELESICKTIEEYFKKLKPSKPALLAFDTEFIREKTFFPKLEIIQIAYEKEAWLVDIQAFESDPKKLKSLLELFRDKKIIKVAHAAQADQECLYYCFKKVATPVLDTAIAAALCGYGDGIGLKNLLSQALRVKIKKGHSRTNWSMRPIPKELCQYALEDVEFLPEMGEMFLKELVDKKRDAWALEIASQWEDKKNYEPQSLDLANKLFKSGRVDPDGYSVLVKLVEWRDRRVRELDIPKKWLADDSLLMDLAKVKPKEIRQLQNFRGFHKGEINSNGEKILALINDAKNNSDLHPPEKKKVKALSSYENRAVDLIRCYLGVLADENRIVSRYLMNAEQITNLVRIQHKILKPESLVEFNIMDQEAFRLVGQNIFDFIQGDKSLTIKNKKVIVSDIYKDSKNTTLRK